MILSYTSDITKQLSTPLILYYPKFGWIINRPLGHVNEKDGRTEAQTGNLLADKKPSCLVSMDKFKYPIKFYEKNHNKETQDRKFKNEKETAISRKEHTVTTNTNKIVHRKLISNPLPFQQTVAAPTMRINSRQNYDQPSCSKTLDMESSGGNPCTYARKRTHKPNP